MKKLMLFTLIAVPQFTSSIFTGKGKSILLPNKNLTAWLTCALLALVLFPAMMFAAPSDYNTHDFNKLQAFLNQPSKEVGKKNGQVLNASYNQDEPLTWTGVTWTSGEGSETRLAGIFWDNKEMLYGNLDISGCTGLVQLYCSVNNIYGLNVWGCTALQILSSYQNAVQSLDVSSLKSLSYLACGRNWLSSLDVSGLPLLDYLWSHAPRLPH
jgi:hypothetical protein